MILSWEKPFKENSSLYTFQWVYDNCGVINIGLELSTQHRACADHLSFSSLLLREYFSNGWCPDPVLFVNVTIVNLWVLDVELHSSSSGTFGYHDIARLSHTPTYCIWAATAHIDFIFLVVTLTLLLPAVCVSNRVHYSQCWCGYKVMVSLPDKPPTSIFFRFLASKTTTVSFPAVGTYRREKQISPSFSCYGTSKYTVWIWKSKFTGTFVFITH